MVAQSAIFASVPPCESLEEEKQTGPKSDWGEFAGFPEGGADV